jgi:hypothetical protein
MIIKLPIYYCKVHFIEVEKNIDIDKKHRTIYKKHKINKSIPKEEDGSNAGILIPCFTDYYMIISNEEKNKINTILHELSHCVDFILEDRDINDTESRAYLTAYLGEKILKNLYGFTIYSKCNK